MVPEECRRAACGQGARPLTGPRTRSARENAQAEAQSRPLTGDGRRRTEKCREQCEREIIAASRLPPVPDRLALSGVLAFPGDPARRRNREADASPACPREPLAADGSAIGGTRSSISPGVAIAVPANGYLDAFGRRWDCDRGYRKAGETCTVIDLPEHAYLSSGGSWEVQARVCDGAGQSCVAVAVPENGYLDDSGDDWLCERGFRVSGDACARLKIPPNGYLGRSGDAWKCNRGLQKDERNVRCGRGAQGRLPQLIQEATGLSERDFRRQGEGSCVALAVPTRITSTTGETTGLAIQGLPAAGETCSADEIVTRSRMYQFYYFR